MSLATVMPNLSVKGGLAPRRKPPLTSNVRPPTSPASACTTPSLLSTLAFLTRREQAAAHNRGRLDLSLLDSCRAHRCPGQSAHPSDTCRPAPYAKHARMALGLIGLRSAWPAVLGAPDRNQRSASCGSTARGRLLGLVLCRDGRLWSVAPANLAVSICSASSSSAA